MSHPNPTHQDPGFFFQQHHDTLQWDLVTLVPNTEHPTDFLNSVLLGEDELGGNFLF